jgi:glycosyltransferase involved in cell wall biosynthesis
MMTNVLLLHPSLLFYKIRLYNRLAGYLRQKGMRLYVWPLSMAACQETVSFDVIERPMTLGRYGPVLREYDIGLVVNLLNRTQPGLLFYVWSVLRAKATGRQAFYYGHGLNMTKKTSVAQVLGSNLLHTMFDGLILYSPREKRFLWKRNRRKASVAPNTLDMEGREQLVTRDKAAILKSLGIKQPHVVLFSGRIQPRKRLDVLLRLFDKLDASCSEWALAVVGPGLDEQTRSQYERHGNVYFLGPLYDRTSVAEVFSACDIFSIPGAMGLAIVESLYWGKPVVTLEGHHGPELHYLNDGNSFVCRDEEDYDQKMRYLMNHLDVISVMGRAARSTYGKFCTLDRFLEGFHTAICRPKRGHERDGSFQACGRLRKPTGLRKAQ